jgi:hypothetical protein
MAIFIRDNDNFAILDCEISYGKLRECATPIPRHPYQGPLDVHKTTVLARPCRSD